MSLTLGSFLYLGLYFDIRQESTSNMR